MSDAPTDIGLAEVLDAHRQQIVDLINTSQPGQIVAWDHAAQRASVQPLVKKMHVQEDETEVTEAQPIINNVIVMQLGAGRGRITFPIAVGDTCLLLHTNCSIASFSQTGGLVDPKDTRRHDISDTIAIVGLHDFGHVPTDAPVNAIVMWAASGIQILLGGNSGLDSTFKVAAFFDKFDTFIASIVSALGSPGPGDAVASAYTTFKGFLTTYSTSVVQVK